MIEVELLDDDRAARDFNPVLMTVGDEKVLKQLYIKYLLLYSLLDTRFYNQSIDWQQMDVGQKSFRWNG